MVDAQVYPLIDSVAIRFVDQGSTPDQDYETEVVLTRREAVVLVDDLMAYLQKTDLRH